MLATAIDHELHGLVLDAASSPSGVAAFPVRHLPRTSGQAMQAHALRRRRQRWQAGGFQLVEYTQRRIFRSSLGV